LDHNPIIPLYMFVFILIGSVLCINFFMAVISMKFSEAQESGEKTLFSENHRQWIIIVNRGNTLINYYTIL
jgi:hypothetical protein